MLTSIILIKWNKAKIAAEAKILFIEEAKTSDLYLNNNSSIMTPTM